MSSSKPSKFYLNHFGANLEGVGERIGVLLYLTARDQLPGYFYLHSEKSFAFTSSSLRHHTGDEASKHVTDARGSSESIVIK